MSAIEHSEVNYHASEQSTFSKSQEESSDQETGIGFDETNTERD
jgi:hypothetical protein